MKSNKISSLKEKVVGIVLLSYLILNSVLVLNIEAKSIDIDNSIIGIQYVDHAPILILSNDNFTDYSFPGLGTSEEPYIIEDLRIITTTSNGIEINDTSVYFIIRNCYIETDGKGILVRYAGDGMVVIENNHMVGNDADAIIVSYTDSPIVANNTGVGDHTGVRMHASNNPLIYNNSFYGGNPLGYIAASGTYLSSVYSATMYNNTFDDFNRGIFTLDCSNCLFINNTCLNTKEYGAIYLSSSYDSYVINNTITTSLAYDGIRLYQSDRNEIAYNTITYCDDYGINMQPGSDDNIIYHNNLFDNNIGGSSQGFDTSSSYNNKWYNEGLSEGNYWDDYIGSGAYTISGDSGIYDLYPLEYPMQYSWDYNASIPLDDIYEENDDFYEAALISVNTTHTLYAFDDDYFTLDLTSSQHIELILSFNDLAVDLDLYLCDYTGEIIAGSEGFASPEIVNFDCTYSGTYFIVVVYFSGSIGLQYDLFIEITPRAIFDDEYEDNDYLDEAATLPDEGNFILFYADIDLFNITLSRDYTYTFTMSFNSQIIDLDMYLLPPDFNGEEEDIEAYSNLYTSPEQFTYRPSYSDVYTLFILAYVEDEYDLITPSEYTLTISKTLYTTEDPGNGDDKITLTSFSVILIPLSIVTLVMIFKKRRK
ncbi:MAG: right-handed parallel beta-helix repeat-containing protein [Candidatus Heimdallarchaeota archaeon]|nr:right-handed parallel beta-helix repeat-containing protein [Candidatus Heimdallarchaeota archaeon]MCK4876628.1 right-handed parallel beta-helix repeat-containing protein [Candidatus Heimdallarchaeota archaeon]